MDTAEVICRTSLTEGQVEMLRLASECEAGIAEGDIPSEYLGRPRDDWLHDLDQLEAGGLICRIGHRYVATPDGDVALGKLYDADPTRWKGRRGSHARRRRQDGRPVVVIYTKTASPPGFILGSAGTRAGGVRSQ